MTREAQGSAQRFEAILAGIAAEEPAGRLERWQGMFDRLAGQRAKRLVLFGAGQYGQWILARLHMVGLEPCCFSDNRPELWGTCVDGLEVLSPSGAVQQFGQTACFIVSIYNGSSAREQLRLLGCASVLPAPVLFWKYPAAFMPDLGIDSPEPIVEQVEQIRQCYALLSDEASRHELCSQVEWRYWRKPEYLPLLSEQGELYFPSDLISENRNEVVVDGGAYDGDTMRSFLRRGHSFQHLYALEPDRENLTGLRCSVEHLPAALRKRVTVWPYALGDKDEEVMFIDTHDLGSRISPNEQGTAVEARKLDSLPWQDQPTYIKLDIEGAEPFGLSGGAALLKREMPVLAICLYHRTQHLWQIPNLIHSLAPGYSFYLRRYAEDCWEEICYAVPPGRAVVH